VALTTHPPPGAEVKERVELPLLHLWAFVGGYILTFILPLPLYLSNENLLHFKDMLQSLFFFPHCCLCHNFIFFSVQIIRFS
jgi:hypothetical protein